ncbi:hypothetical protein [Leptothrix discophora]|uniref:Uncharacterized protein n=1 Tax=Leptothrix discophora TaxID=89 RepID=A0ABT9G9M2_LEPDI|nr:hypothetical protein [Leptothrix discophora]MDP4302958.1 hypothetical protein [Leptothrix discophora]
MSIHDRDYYREHHRAQERASDQERRRQQSQAQPGPKRRSDPPRSTPPPQQLRPHLDPSRWRRATARPRWLLWCGLALAAILIAHVIGGLKSQQPFPEPGTVHWYVAETQGPKAPLTLRAPLSGPADFAVRFDHWESRAPVALVPIRSGMSAHLEMPLGRYRMTISKGLLWQGPGKLFHITTDAREAVDPVEFTRVGDTFSGHTIQLETLAGNMDTRRAR